MSDAVEEDLPSRVRKPRPELKIYRPGSGPLRKRADGENDPTETAAAKTGQTTNGTGNKNEKSTLPRNEIQCQSVEPASTRPFTEHLSKANLEKGKMKNKNETGVDETTKKLESVRISRDETVNSAVSGSTQKSQPGKNRSRGQNKDSQQRGRSQERLASERPNANLVTEPPTPNKGPGKYSEQRERPREEPPSGRTSTEPKQETSSQNVGPKRYSEQRGRAREHPSSGRRSVEPVLDSRGWNRGSQKFTEQRERSWERQSATPSTTGPQVDTRSGHQDVKKGKHESNRNRRRENPRQGNAWRNDRRASLKSVEGLDNKNNSMNDRKSASPGPWTPRGDNRRRAEKEAETENWDIDNHLQTNGNKDRRSPHPRRPWSRSSQHQSLEREEDWDANTYNSPAGKPPSRAASRSSSISNFITYPESEPEPPDSPTAFMRRESFSPGKFMTRPGCEPPSSYTGMQSPYQSDYNFTRESTSVDRYLEAPNAGYRVDSKPPSGRRDRPVQLPSNFSSLPPRFQRKLAEEVFQNVVDPGYPMGFSPNPMHANQAGFDWDGSSLTFSGSGGRRTPQAGSSISQPRGRGQGSRNREIPSSDLDDLDSYLVSSREHNAIPVGPEQCRDRRNSQQEPRTPTQTTQPHHALTADSSSNVPDVTFKAKTSPEKLDWSEEMELEDKASMASTSTQSSGKPAAVSTPRTMATSQQQFNFKYSDIRYRDKPEAGILVINKGETLQHVNPADSSPARGRPLLGQSGHNSPRPSPAPQQVHPPPNYNCPPPRGGGILVVPQAPPPSETRRYDGSRDFGGIRAPLQRSLYDPSNPSKPVMTNIRPDSQYQTNPYDPRQRPIENMYFHQEPPAQQKDSVGYEGSKPAWYDLSHESILRNLRCDPRILQDIKRADIELTVVIRSMGLLRNWGRVVQYRNCLEYCLQTILVTDIKFAESENIEQHVWKLAFHNVIEALRKGAAEDADYREQYKTCLLSVIDQGLSYFEKQLELLQERYNFCLDDYLEPQPRNMSGLGYVGLALIASQKIFLFMGDLARYREATTETSNLNKARAWYNKANVLNPKNGRPYNQLALLALHARRRLDAVYLYMRSLMASNPFLSAKESLLSLFEENRKKFEQQDRKRREEKEVKRRERLKLKESVVEHADASNRNIRREIWFHPQGGKKFQRTTAAPEEKAVDSDEEELNELSSADVNKRFVASFLHVHGKLFTRTGMETFQDVAVQMLQEFRNLLQRSPIPVNQSRLVQLLALNMFSLANSEITSTALRDGHRSAIHESALIVSLEMFSVILERCNILLKEQLDNPNLLAPGRLLSEDLQNLVPAVKVWSDWLLCHTASWNPPPDTSEYHVGPPGTPWTRLATLINLLSRVNVDVVTLSTQCLQGYELVKLPEDIALAGFLPLMTNTQEPMYTRTPTDMDLAADCLRVHRLLYFGRDYLCGVEPPVLRLHFLGPFRMEYVSAVESQAAGASQSGQTNSELQQPEAEEVVESYSGSEDDEEPVVPEGATHTGELSELRQRKEELERRHLVQQQKKQHVKDILREGVRLVMEIRPKFLVADTNCYIDHLDVLKTLAIEKNYTVMVPLVVLNELNGLCGSRLQQEAQNALSFLREKNPHVRFVTSKGAPIPSITFAMEETSDETQVMTNDDRILQCCTSLIRDKGGQESLQDGVRHLRRDVVLLTDDRNLRVKALARDVPVSELSAFKQWAFSA